MLIKVVFFAALFIGAGLYAIVEVATPANQRTIASVQNGVTTDTWICNDAGTLPLEWRGEIVSITARVSCGINARPVWENSVPEEAVMREAFGLEQLSSQEPQAGIRTFTATLKHRRPLSPGLEGWGPQWNVDDESEIKISKAPQSYSIVKTGLSLTTDHPILSTMRSIDSSASLSEQDGRIVADFTLTAHIDTLRGTVAALGWKYAKPRMEKSLAKATRGHLLRFQGAFIKSLNW